MQKTAIEWLRGGIMSFTQKEIDLAHRLHDLGVRPEIQEGDWIVWKSDTYILPMLIHDTDEYKKDIGKRAAVILLPSWERCREWLEKKGWLLWSHHQLSGPVTLSYYKNPAKQILGIEGQTDLEAILEMAIKVAEGAKE